MRRGRGVRKSRGSRRVGRRCRGYRGRCGGDRRRVGVRKSPSEERDADFGGGGRLAAATAILAAPLLLDRAPTSLEVRVARLTVEAGGLDLLQPVFSGVLVAPEADVENAAVQKFPDDARLGLQAQPLRLVPPPGVAVLEGELLALGMHLEGVVEQGLAVIRHGAGHSLLDLALSVVVWVVVHVSTVAVLTARDGGHRDLDVQVVGPAHHLHVHTQREPHVHNVLLQVVHAVVDGNALRVVHNLAGTAWQVELAELPKDGIAVELDATPVHRPHLDPVVVNERPADENIVDRREAFGELRRVVLSLDGDLRAFHQPEDALGDEGHLRPVEGLQMRISPHGARLPLPLRHRRGWHRPGLALLATSTRIGAAPLLFGVRPLLWPHVEVGLAIIVAALVGVLAAPSLFRGTPAFPP
mmetsp:Transcript_30779/g.88907  ORF Transcript_30779/g.88907 Transcript_30779/m.88907 type:complete len:413 (-) Transcript_30779:13-1251(-)